MGVWDPGLMSVVQNATPLVVFLGICPERSGGMYWLDTGTESREWNVEKVLPLGPKGWNWEACSSATKVEVPLPVWPDTTTRGAGSSARVDIVVAQGLLREARWWYNGI